MTFAIGKTQDALVRQYDFWGRLTDKECGKCQAILSVDAFAKSKRSFDGLANWCTPCKVKYNRATCRVTKRTNNLKHFYGLTQDQWTALFESQERRCACCGSEKAGTVHGWQTDHVHGTKIVRNILCLGCNTAIGNLQEKPERADQIASYLRKHAQAIPVA